MLTQDYTEKYIVYTKIAVFTVFSKPIEFTLGTQTFNQHSYNVSRQHNIFPVHTLFTVVGHGFLIKYGAKYVKI